MKKCFALLLLVCIVLSVSPTASAYEAGQPCAFDLSGFLSNEENCRYVEMMLDYHLRPSSRAFPRISSSVSKRNRTDTPYGAANSISKNIRVLIRPRHAINIITANANLHLPNSNLLLFFPVIIRRPRSTNCGRKFSFISSTIFSPALLSQEFTMKA